MKSVKKFEFPATSFGQSTHNWDGILAAKVDRDALGKPGPAVVLVAGDDFEVDINPNQFVSMCRNVAAKRHLKIKASIVKSDDKPAHIYIQCADMNDEEAAAADARFEASKELGKQRRLAKKAGESETVGGIVPATAQAS